MQILLDPDVEGAIAYLQANVPSARLVETAEALASLAPVLWDHFKTGENPPLTLVPSECEPKAARG